jgi:hypothetical protein
MEDHTMLIDQLNVFFDKVASAAAMTGKAVFVGPYLGRSEPVNVFLNAVGTVATAVTFAVAVKESDAVNGTFTPAANLTLVKAGGATEFAHSLRLPRNLSKPYVRIDLALTGTTVTGLTVSAMVTRDDFAPYAPGQYIDHGKVYA